MSKDIQENDFSILIVDDVTKNIQLLGKILDHQGYRVIAVTKGDQVLKTAKKHSPDLILLDIMMPEKSGFEVCEELKADEQLSEIPVIFLTARSDEEDILKGFKQGGADYITKPFNSEELLARVATHLDLKRARDQIIRQREELFQQSQTRDKLYSIIAHDLRGALFGITGLAEIVAEDLEKQSVDDDIKDSITLMLYSAASAGLILENLLAWTRLQTSNLKVNPEKFSLSKKIEESTHLYQVQANKKGVKISITPESKNEMIFADKHMISTVLRNLISNAIKFSNNDDQITIKTMSTANGVQITVKDEGVGMEEAVQKNIFNPENRPKKTGTDHESGTGLGLLLCKEFIEAHKGEIWIKSESGNGSEFSFLIPQ